MKRISLAAILTAGAVLITSGCGAVKAGKPAITVGEIKVTMNDISLFLSAGDDFDSSKKRYVELMEETIKYGELGKAMGIELTDEDKNGIIQSKASFASNGGGLNAYKEYLKKAGSSMDFLETLFTDNVYQTKVTDQIKEELGDEEPSDDEIKKYFLENYYRAKHVLVNLEAEATEEPEEESGEEPTEEASKDEPTAEPTPVAEEDGKTGRELAELILKKAEDGEDFDKLVKTYNQDPGMAGNEDGYIFTEGEMVDEFEECVKGLEPGEFGICETSYGYHVIQRLPFDEEQKKFNEWLESKKDAVSGKIHDDKVKARLDELCEEHSIESSIDWDAVDAFTEEMLVKNDNDEQ